MRTAIWTIALALAIGGGLLSFIFSELIPAEKILDFNKSLLDLSALIFAIIGAWLALFFPDAFKGVLGSTTEPKVNKEARDQRISLLFASMLAAGLVVIGSVIIAYASQYAQLFVLFVEKSTLKSLLSLAVYIAFILLLYSILNSLAPILVFLTRVLRAKSEDEAKTRAGLD